MRSAILTTYLVFAILTGGGRVPLSLASAPSAVPSTATAPLRDFGEVELKELLTNVLQRDHVQDKGELELRFTRPWQIVTVSNEPITLNILQLPTAGVSPNFIVRFELTTPTHSIGTYQMPVTAQVWREIWVARSPLTRGELLANCDRVKERRDVLALRDAALGDEIDAAAWQLAANVPAGAPIYENSVKLRTIVHRGQAAMALVRDQAMTVSLKVEVLEDGALGQDVRVRNIQSERIFHGKVQDERTIIINL
jgi:flagella basal body P-ring formation protein FlgA